MQMYNCNMSDVNPQVCTYNDMWILSRSAHVSAANLATLSATTPMIKANLDK